MKYKEIRNLVEKLGNESYEDFIKAIVSFEKGINDMDALDKIYAEFMDSDTKGLLHEDFDYMIDELRENGEIKDVPFVEEEKDNLVNIVGNVIGEVEVLDRETKDGKPFTVVNFAVASKDKNGNGVITNCSAYGNKAEIPMEFKKGDFVKLFGEVRTSIDNKGKEHSNVRILSSKILKTREQMKKGSSKNEKEQKSFDDNDSIREHLSKVYEDFIRNEGAYGKTIVLAEKKTKDGKHQMGLELDLEDFSWLKKIDGLIVEKGDLRTENQNMSDTKLLKKYLDSLDIDKIFTLQEGTLEKAGIKKASIIEYLKKSKNEKKSPKKTNENLDIRQEIDR